LIDGDHHFKMPLFGSGQRSRANASAYTQTGLHRPVSHRFVREFNAASRQQLPV
jgi:hypothetical protein